MIRGPKEYVPPVEVEVVTKRSAIPLDENEGIYVRDTKTGKVRNHFFFYGVQFHKAFKKKIQLFLVLFFLFHGGNYLFKLKTTA